MQLSITLHVHSGTNDLRCQSDPHSPRGECSPHTRHCHHRGEITDASRLFDSLTYLPTQREPLATPHSGSGAPRAGTLNFKCLGVLVVFASIELAQLSDGVERQRLREQISRISLCRNLHHIQPAFIPHCLQPKMSHVHVHREPKHPTCCGSTTPWLSHAIVTRVLIPPPLIKRLPSRFAARSLSGCFFVLQTIRTSAMRVIHTL